MINIDALMFTSDWLLAHRIIEHPNARPDRISQIQLALDRLAEQRRGDIDIVTIATESGTAEEIAERYGMSRSAVYVARAAYRRQLARSKSTV